MKCNYLGLCLGLSLLMSFPVKAVTRAELDSLVADLQSPDPNTCSIAAIKLAEHGPAATEVFPDLVEIVRRNESPFYASTIIQYIAPSRPLDEIRLLTEDNAPSVQSLAVECLKHFDLDRDQTLKIYSAWLDHENPFVRLGAVDALCRIGAGQLCVDTLVSLSGNADPLIQAMAISALEHAQIADKQIERMLLNAFANTDKREVAKAALIYQKLFPNKNEGTQQLRQLLADQDRNVRWHAVRAIGNLKNVDSQTLQLAQKLMQDNDKIVVINACYMMIRHSIELELAWSMLDKSLETDVFEDLITPVMVLRELGPKAHRYQDRLLELLGSRDEAVQFLAAFVLPEIQPEPARVLPVLEKKLNETDNFRVWNSTMKTVQTIKQR